LTTTGTYHTRQPHEPHTVLIASAKTARIAWLISAIDGSERIEVLSARDRLLRAERELRMLP
jgi:hypothetical protein